MKTVVWQKKKVYLLQWSLFAHKLAEGESAIVVAIHSLEEVLNFGPAGEPQLLYVANNFDNIITE